MADVRRGEVGDAKDIGAALASAFSDDPLFAWMTGPKAPLEKRLRIFFANFAKLNLRRADHLVFVAEDGSGAAIWQQVDKWRVPPADLIRSAPALLGTFRRRVPVALRALGTNEKHHPEEPHYYLEFLGTRADRQSKGVGSAVMADMLDQCDTEGRPAYLESSNPRNIPFYARHGFKVREEMSLGKGAPVCTSMWREPR